MQGFPNYNRSFKGRYGAHDFFCEKRFMRERGILPFVQSL